MTLPACSGTAIFLQGPLCVSLNLCGRWDRNRLRRARLDPAPLLQPGQAVLDGRPQVAERRELGHRTAAVGDDPLRTSFGLADETAQLRLGLADSDRQTLHVVIVVSPRWELILLQNHSSSW